MKFKQLNNKITHNKKKLIKFNLIIRIINKLQIINKVNLMNYIDNIYKIVNMYHK